MPEEKVATNNFGDIDAYLVESRSIGGLSGSPVYAHITAPRIKEDGTLDTSITLIRYIWLIGLIHGHYDMPIPDEDALVENALNKESVNMGIAIVVPSEKIMDVLNHPIMVRDREEEMKAILEKNDANKQTSSKEKS